MAGFWSRGRFHDLGCKLHETALDALIWWIWRLVPKSHQQGHFKAFEDGHNFVSRSWKTSNFRTGVENHHFVIQTPILDKKVRTSINAAWKYNKQESEML